MKRRAFCVLAATGTASAAALEPGTLAPDIALPQANLPIGRLSDLRGRVVYLDFWASWCGPCRLSFPWMARLQANHQARGLQVLALNLDERRADADAFLARTPAAFGVAFDASGEGAKRFGVKGMPSSALIDANGRLLWQHRGFRLDEAPELERRIVEALPRQ